MSGQSVLFELHQACPVGPKQPTNTSLSPNRRVLHTHRILQFLSGSLLPISDPHSPRSPLPQITSQCAPFASPYSTQMPKITGFKRRHAAEQVRHHGHRLPMRQPVQRQVCILFNHVSNNSLSVHFHHHTFMTCMSDLEFWFQT